MPLILKRATQDGVELGVYIREAIEEAGKPFGELSPEQIGAALRKYEVARSHRVAHIVDKSGKIGSMFMIMGYLVRPLSPATLGRCCTAEGDCAPAHVQDGNVQRQADLPERLDHGWLQPYDQLTQTLA